MTASHEESRVSEGRMTLTNPPAQPNPIRQTRAELGIHSFTDPTPWAGHLHPSTDFTGLSINNNLHQPIYPPREEPPPPMISSEGIVAVDITSKFFSSAASKSQLLVCVNEVMLTCATQIQRWSLASS